MHLFFDLKNFETLATTVFLHSSLPDQMFLRKLGRLFLIGHCRGKHLYILSTNSTAHVKSINITISLSPANANTSLLPTHHLQSCLSPNTFAHESVTAALQLTVSPSCHWVRDEETSSNLFFFLPAYCNNAFQAENQFKEARNSVEGLLVIHVA